MTLRCIGQEFGNKALDLKAGYQKRFGHSLVCEDQAMIEKITSPRRVMLDTDSTKVRGYGRQEQSDYNGHFESTCYHPLLCRWDGRAISRWSG
jgi:hypothetical protein